MKQITAYLVAISVVVTGTFVTPAAAEPDLSKFPLAKAIPSDVFHAVMGRANPERAFLDAYWEEVIEAFMQSGILTDVWDLITDSVSDEQIEAVEEIQERFGELCGKIAWSDLCAKEMVNAGRIKTGPGYMFYEGVVLGRSDKKKALANFEAIKALAQELVKLIETEAGEGMASLTESKMHHAKTVTLAFQQFGGAGASLALRDDVVIITFGGNSILSDVLARLDGTAKDRGLIATDRFQKAFADLPPAEDELGFFDAERLLTVVRQMFQMIAGEQAQMAKKVSHVQEEGEKAQAQAHGDERKQKMKLVAALLEDLSIPDYVASVQWTEGHRVFTDSVTAVRKQAQSSPILKILTSGKPVRQFERFIPQGADSFQVSSGINLLKLYEYLIGMADKHIPDAAEHIAAFKEMQEGWEIDIKKNVLAVIDGGSASASVGKDWVFLLKVTDEAKAMSLVDRLFAAVAGLLGENAPIVMPFEVDGATNFKQVSHPMMMVMMGGMQPIFGCSKGHFILGSSANIVRTCLKTADGKHPNITKSDRWRAEALAPEGAVSSIAFTDESNMARELQEGITGISMALGMAGWMAADLPAAARDALNLVPPLLAKLAPVAGKMDFYRSSASYVTYDGSKWYSRKVQNYKKPSERKKAEPAESIGSQ